MFQTIQLCKDSMKTMQETVTAAMGLGLPQVAKTTANTLQTAMNKLYTVNSGISPTTCITTSSMPAVTTRVANHQQVQYGIVPSSVQNTDLVSSEIRTKILSGKDINLNTLFNYSYEKKSASDPRLTRNLSLQEFQQIQILCAIKMILRLFMIGHEN